MAEMRPNELSQEKLADGNVLLSLKERFQDEMTEDNLIELMQVLRESTLILPMQIMMSASDQEKMKLNDVGVNFVPEDEIRVIPAVAAVENENYMFIFSQAEQIPVDYSESVTLMRASFAKVYNYLAEDDTVFGLILDPFTENLELPRELVEAIAQMEPRFPVDD